MKIDLFGGTGFVGNNFKKLYNDDTHVHDREDNIPIHDNIVYMISTTHNYHVFDNIYKDVDTNLTKLLNVLQNCKDKNIVFNFISSWFVYGDVELPAKEDSDCKPKGFYSITKRCAEDMIISYCETFKIKYRILRLCNVYGPSDSGVSKQKNALQYLINEIKSNNEIKLYYDGDFIRDYMHVDDICRALKIVLDKGENNQVYNIASGSSINFKELIQTAKELTKSQSKIIFIPGPEKYKSIQGKNFTLNTDKLKSLGFKPEIGLHEGLQSLCF
jgi:nucleoside-diphosphate-sugar epimerase